MFLIIRQKIKQQPLLAEDLFSLRFYFQFKACMVFVSDLLACVLLADDSTMPERRVSDADLERVLEVYEDILDSPQSDYSCDSSSHYSPSPAMSASMTTSPSSMATPSPVSDISETPPSEYYETYQDLTGHMSREYINLEVPMSHELQNMADMMNMSQDIQIKQENNMEGYPGPPSYEEHMVQSIKREIQEFEHCLAPPPSDNTGYNGENWMPRHSDYLHGYNVETPPTTPKKGESLV